MIMRKVFALLASIAFAGSVNAAEVIVSENIDTSTTWTNDNVYRLTQQIFVMPGATLTIEPGTVIASETGVGGSLAVARGARIYVNGTELRPVIMTSTSDVETWDPDPAHPAGGDPKTGTWREAVNEWGNLTIMGNGLISASHFDGSPLEVTLDDDGEPGGSTTTRINTKVPDGMNMKQMEGLVADFPGDPKVLYGGANDNDNSGSISYLSIRYGGRVIGLGNELNGLSLGAVGRETDIHHVEIMNNVDDGIEIWGGTVQLKYVNIWNVGDDSFDIDQGWRGKAQFGLIVQGFSTDADQGSGVGDNCIETDGAEDSDAQPVTTATVYNFTVIGQPVDGDGGTAWRDNARMQYRNCIFMDLGEQLVRFDDVDGDGAQGYGFNGTLSWEETWNTSYEHSHNYAATVNAISPEPAVDALNHPMVLYQTQFSGNLAEITDSVFYNNNFEDTEDNVNAYTEAEARGVLADESNNVVAADDASPIQAIERDDLVVRGGKTMARVNFLNPLPANDALTSVAAAPEDSFFEPAQYRGAFPPNHNWLLNWTAAHAFGLTGASSSVDSERWENLR